MNRIWHRDGRGPEMESDPLGVERDEYGRRRRPVARPASSSRSCRSKARCSRSSSSAPAQQSLLERRDLLGQQGVHVHPVPAARRREHAGVRERRRPGRSRELAARQGVPGPPERRLEHQPAFADARAAHDVAAGRPDAGEKIFKADLTDLRVTWQFNVRSFVRFTMQRQLVTRNLDLYIARDTQAESLNVGTQLLYSYKLNPQTVLYRGLLRQRARRRFVAGASRAPIARCSRR